MSCLDMILKPKRPVCLPQTRPHSRHRAL